MFALARSPSAGDKLRALGAKPVEGDLGDAARLRCRLWMQSCMWPPTSASRGRVPLFSHERGRHCRAHPSRRSGRRGQFVYLSAAAIVMDDRGSPVRNADESAPTFPNSFSAYIASKARAEAVVLAANRPGFRTRPCARP